MKKGANIVTVCEEAKRLIHRLTVADKVLPPDLEIGLGSDQSENVTRKINDFVDEIAVSGDIVVVRTPPGAAHLVAGAIDAVRLDGVLGTVAGDDTLMVIAAPVPGGAGIADRIEQIGAGR